MKNLKEYRIESIRFSDEEGFYDEVSAVFGFPDYFGRNLDALADCLSDLETPFAIVWSNAEKSRSELWDFFDVAVSVFEESTETFVLEV